MSFFWGNGAFGFSPKLFYQVTKLALAWPAKNEQESAHGPALLPGLCKSSLVCLVWYSLTLVNEFIAILLSDNICAEEGHRRKETSGKGYW